MFVDILLFLVGLAGLWLSSEVIIRKIGPLARFFGVKELVITVLGVSVLSSLPELTVSAFAIARGQAEISVGNVIGSNFVTLTFVTAVCALIRPIDIHREVRDREAGWMILSSSLVMVLSLDGTLARSDGLILLLAYVPYILSVLSAARADRSGPEAGDRPAGKTAAIAALIAAAGVAGVIGFSSLALDRGSALGEAAGIPPVAMGVILFAFGTSLPELAISLSATLKKKADVTIGEVYASNIFTQLVVLGICCLIAPISVSGSILGFAMPFLVLAAGVIQLFVTSGLKLNRLEAVGLLGFYALFAASQFTTMRPLHELLGF